MALDRVLIADDEPDVVRQLEATFSANGFRTIGAINGIEAWNALLQYPDEIAACVVDLQMPPGNFGGRDLIQKVRNAFSKLLPIVVYSGRGTVSLAHEVTKVGANAFIEKESGQDHLVNVVARLISEIVRPGHNFPSSLNALAASGDLQWHASRSFKELEVFVRTAVLSKYTPRQLHSLFSTKKKPPQVEIMDRLLAIDQFTNETRLCFGDLLDLTNRSIRQSSPIAATSDKTQRNETPDRSARNALEHGRALDTRSLLVALMASDELLEKLQELS